MSADDRRERLGDAARLLERAAAELDRSADHCRVAARHFRDGAVPRAAAHAWAAHGHMLAAGEALGQQAREHAERSQPVA